VHRAIGSSHSGWRGTVARIGAATVDAMGRAYNTRPEDLLAVIGPSICQSCYEVSEDVAQEFQKTFRREQWDEILQKKKNEKYQLDLWQSNRIILEEAGIPKDQIEVSGMCTCCHSDLLFSHRATNGHRGNLAAVMTLGGSTEYGEE
jgi:hypothetical protein